MWLAVSLVSGLATSVIFRRKPHGTTQRRSLPAVLLGLTLTAARPAIKLWLGHQTKLWLARLVSQVLENHLVARPSPPSKFR